ncbi:SSU ribosomal protein S1P [uncultured Paludibacter sp.]|uniref:Small ribosomal subunit protein bS1 n=1 Tax=uncultured Paludibacter sp. TaxID=497635 RepID=A0A653ACF0_9BACT|nr:SSU ribosomal protein S1P [uncultured Paludibacter sp.]
MEEKEMQAEEVVNTPEAVEPTQPAEEITPKAKKTTKKAEAAEEVKVEEEVKETAAEVKEEPKTEEVIEEAPSAKKTVKEEPKQEVKPQEDFDWDAYEKGEVISGKSKVELEKIYDDTLNAIKDKEVVEGTVTSINKREVVINVGFKSDGVVPMSEFRYNPDLKVGDKVEVYIESQEDKKGQLILSHKQARATRSWDRVNAALESQEIVKGFVKCRTKGGMIVDVFGIEAFLPGSQIDVKPIRDYDVFVNKTMEFKVVKINQEFKNVVVSHKALIEEEIEQQKKEIIGKLQKGQVLEGTVKNITSYGVFIDLGGVDGLIHITDLSWGRVSDPKEIVELDQKLNVVILDFDDEKKRIALGLKQLSPHPWDALDPNLKVGDKVKGKVVVMADYGAFIEIAPGVEGLIHVSEMSWSQHLRSAQDFLKVGDEVETVILTLDRDERKMSLGIKQLKSDPWENIEARYPVGSKHTAKVRNFTNFGVFVEIEEGVDGLIHISDLSWTKKIKHPSEFTKIGDDIEVQVLEIDKDNRRLSLGHKQLEENPWDAFESLFAIDTVHEGVITEMMDKGAVVALPYGVEGFVTPKHLVKEDGSQAQVDEKLQFKVIEFNKDAKRIILSHSRLHEEAKRAEKAAAVEDAPKRVKKAKKEETSTPAIEKTTLGDIQSLADLKDQMVNEAAEKLVAKEAKKTAAKAEKAPKAEKEEKPVKEKAPKAKKAEKTEE